jgi:hypothetical protein
MRTIQECLDWFANRKPEREPFFDFNRPIGHPCAKCGYPLCIPSIKYPLKVSECPEHQPPHWKFHERKAQEVAKANDQAEMLMKEIQK